MPDTPPSAPAPAPTPAPEAHVDSITAATPAQTSSPTPAAAPTPATPAAVIPPSTTVVARAKRHIVLITGALYLAYMLWLFFLDATLPDPTGQGASLVSIGLLSCLVGFLAMAFVGFLLLKRISSAPSSIATRRQGLIKLVLVLLPGVLLSGFTPVLIMREPSLPIDIVQPTDPGDFVAPVVVTLSAQRAAGILRNLGFRPIKYQWDTDGDGKMNEETVLPTSSALYPRQGVYTAVLRVQVDGGAVRRLTRRVVIPQQVFSMIPTQPVIQKGVKFSVADLLTDPKLLKEVVWDFGDGNPPTSSVTPDTTHTFYAIGSYPVTAIVQLTNQSQLTYKRAVSVIDTPPLPFPITLKTEPKTLVGPIPFGVLFSLETKQNLNEVDWDFGDGKQDHGIDLTRESHEFTAPGIYPVIVRARAGSGKLAELTTIVRATPVLDLRDLTFDGTPAVEQGKIAGDLPLEINLTPKTSTPLVQFEWQISEDIPLVNDNGTLKGVLRTPGAYTVTLMAQGAEGKSMLRNITITVKPASAEPMILMTPDGGTAPLTVTFDASQTFIPSDEVVAGFKWFFGDEAQGAPQPELGAAHIQHTFKNPGQYQIELHVVMASGKEITDKRTIVVRKPALTACLTASRTEVEAGKGVEFDSGCSTGVSNSILWDIRRVDKPDTIEAQSDQETYAYVFAEPGEYTVSLVLKDKFGNEDVKSIVVTVNPAP